MGRPITISQEPRSTYSHYHPSSGQTRQVRTPDTIEPTGDNDTGEVANPICRFDLLRAKNRMCLPPTILPSSYNVPSTNASGGEQKQIKVGLTQKKNGNIK